MFGIKFELYLNMQVSEIQLFQILKGKIGEKEAQTLVEYVEIKLKKNLTIKGIR